MKIKTKYHGEREYELNDIITFKNGLPGFEALTKYIIFPTDENEIFSILHSTEDLSIGLIVTSPFMVCDNYEFDLKESVMERLNIKHMGEVNILNTVTLSSQVENITINLKAPIIINIVDKIGEQIILDDEKYQIRHPLLKEGSDACTK
jgi:flagellar assembly factor FliW